MHLHAHKVCGAHELCTRAKPCDLSAGAHGGVTAGQAPPNSSNVGVVTAGQVGHNSGAYKPRY